MRVLDEGMSLVVPHIGRDRPFMRPEKPRGSRVGAGV